MYSKVENFELIKYKSGLIKSLENKISVTNKLLAIVKDELIPYRIKDKWGFCLKDKRIVIECQYQEVHFYFENLAGVKKEDKWGFIDETGNEIISCQYE